MKKRTPKKGVVYLLISDDEEFLKFGASTVSAKSRIRWCNRTYSMKFKVLHEEKSTDIFKSENDFRWWLNENRFYFGMEIFPNNIDLNLLKLKLNEMCV